MKIIKISLISLFLLCISLVSFPQDQRTIETKVADILARFPANDSQLTDKLMGDILQLGDAGIKQICNQIVPAGTGDDTHPRFAVESMSRFLSQKGKEKERVAWEKVCIDYAVNQKDNGVKDFFMKQLQLIGTDLSADAMKPFLSEKEICESALAVVVAQGGKSSETILSESLRSKDLPCAAAAMNALAKMKSNAAVNEFIAWASTSDVNVKASAYNALAMSGSPQAYPVLSKAAADASYKWEQTGATAALLNYAKVVGENGDTKTMDKICRLVIKTCNDDININYKTTALNIYVGSHGINAMTEVLRAASHSNSEYRSAAMRMTLAIPGPEVVRKWVTYFPKAQPAAKPEIITMLGIRGDETALPLLNKSLSDTNFKVRKETAEAVAKISGSEAISSLITYMLVFGAPPDQEAAKSALMTVLASENMPYLIPVLKEGSPAAKKTAIELFSWKKENKYFPELFPFTSSSDEIVRAAAFKSLANIAGPDDQQKLIDLLASTDNPEYITDLQAAIAAAAEKISDPERRSSAVLNAMNGKVQKEKLIPVLAKTGGSEALNVVTREFENGNPQIRDLSFAALASWRDHSAAAALYEICASGNKTFEAPAFKGYVEQVRKAQLSDDQKLLLYRKIMPYALTAERKNEILRELGRLRSYTSLFYVAGFLEDPSTVDAAARAAISIALPSVESGLNGENVKDILTKVITKIQGAEAEYDKEMVRKYLAGMPASQGFKPMFNGKDLTGWKGLVENPVARTKMKPVELAIKQAAADRRVPANWTVKDGSIWFSGKGDNLCSVKDYGDFEMYVDWKISKNGDSGIYLRGTPQVQIWDPTGQEEASHAGSGGLYNNEKNPSKPLMVADNAIGDWNTFRIRMIGEKVTVWLNGQLVVDNVTMENYWDRSIPIFPKGAIELQAHGNELAFRDIYVREISDSDFNLTPEEKAQGFAELFNGRNLDNWIGNKESYVAEDGMIIVKPNSGSGGNLFTEKQYQDFIFRFEFLLTPAANNGLGIRASETGDAAYNGMELQILDNTAEVYANLQPYQYHGSVYGVIPAKKGFLKPVGEWNYQEVIVKGTQIKVILNGTVIVDGDIAGPRDNGTMDHNDHPGLKNKTGHIGFLGHGSELKFRNIRIKDLTK